MPRQHPYTRPDNKPDPYVFGRPADKDRDHYSRQVQRIDARPAGTLALEVKLILECGHEIIGKASGKRHRVPLRIFCAECHREACKKSAARIPKAPDAAKGLRHKAGERREEIDRARGKHATPDN